MESIENGSHTLPCKQFTDREKQIRDTIRSRNRVQKIDPIPQMLYHSSNMLVSSNCRVFCNANNKITHLATLADFITYDAIARFSSVLSEHHSLTVISLTDTDPTLQHLNLHVTIPTHLIVVDENVDIRKESHVVHITILHDRIKGKYWWEAPLKLNENQERILHRQGLKRNAFRLPYSSAIFAK